MQTTLRVLQAYPESKIDLKPAEKLTFPLNPFI